MKELPQFKARKREEVIDFVTRIFTLPNNPDLSYFRHLVEYEDGHYGVEFSLGYFVSTEVPTKSQWNSLKKKLKRHDKHVFVYKDHRTTTGDDSEACGFLEIGFFAH